METPTARDSFSGNCSTDGIVAPGSYSPNIAATAREAASAPWALLRLRALLVCFVVGWATFCFSLFDLGRFSITLLVLSSAVLSLLGARAGYAFAYAVPVFFSGLVAYIFAPSVGSLGISKATSHFVQQCLAVGVMLGAAAIPWQKYMPMLRGAFLAVSIIILAYGTYQFAARRYGLPYAFLRTTSQQISSDEGYQRGYSKMKLTGRFSRVSSFFPEPSDLARWMLWLMAFGLVSTGMTRVVIVIVAVWGLALAQSLGGAIGLIVLLFALLFRGRGRGKALLLVLFGVGISLWVLLLLAPEPIYAFLHRFVAATRFDPSVDSSRLVYLPIGLKVFSKAIFFGHGLSSGPATVASTGAIGYLHLLIERGIVGTFLYLLPLGIALYYLAISRTTSEDSGILLAFLLLTLEAYFLASFASLYFPPQWFALGMAIYFLRQGRQHTVLPAYREADSASVSSVARLASGES